MGKRAKELRSRKPDYHDTWWTSGDHIKIKITRRFCDLEDVMVNSYSKLDAIAGLLACAYKYPSTNFGDRMTGLGLILEDIAHDLKVASGSPDDGDKTDDNPKEKDSEAD